MNSTINLSFRYAASDYVRALRAHYASHLRLRLDIVVALVLAGIGAYLWRSQNRQWIGLACIVVAVVFALMLVVEQQEAFEQLLTQRISQIVRRAYIARSKPSLPVGGRGQAK